MRIWSTFFLVGNKWDVLRRDASPFPVPIVPLGLVSGCSTCINQCTCLYNGRGEREVSFMDVVVTGRLVHIPEILKRDCGSILVRQLCRTNKGIVLSLVVCLNDCRLGSLFKAS